MEPIQVALGYLFNERDEPVLDELLAQLESRIGGRRVHRGMSAGAIDLLSALEVVVEILVQAGVGSYFAGILGTEELSKEHKKWLLEQVNRLASLLNQVTACTKDHIRELKLKAAYEDKERAITVRIDLDHTPCYIVLNGPHVDADALSRLEDDVRSMIESLEECELPEDIVAIQLCVDPVSRRWRFLLVPSRNGFGSHVDRVWDVAAHELIYVDSPDQFIRLLQIDEDNSLKVLINPFRGGKRSGSFQIP